MIAEMAPQMARPSALVVGDARRHQQAADVGEAEAQRAVAVGQLGDLARGELRHQHRDLEHDGPQPAGVLEGVDVEALRPASRNFIRFSEARLHAVSSRNMYSEHGFDARIGPDFGQVCQSLMVVWNWMPGSAEAQAAWPICSHRSRAFSVLHGLAVEARGQRPSRRPRSTASRNSSVTRTELLEFWPETVR